MMGLMEYVRIVGGRETAGDESGHLNLRAVPPIQQGSGFCSAFIVNACACRLGSSTWDVACAMVPGGHDWPSGYFFSRQLLP